MLYKLSDFHWGEFSDCGLVGCDMYCCGWIPVVWRDMFPGDHSLRCAMLVSDVSKLQK